MKKIFFLFVIFSVVQLTASELNVKQSYNRLAIDFFRLYVEEMGASSGDNVVICAHSANTALSLCANACRGEALAQINKTLGSLDSVNWYNQNLLYGSNRLIKTYNSIWWSWIEIEPSFIRLARECYNCELQKVPDFSENTRQKINEWVRERTSGRIPSMFDRLSPETELIILNTTLFDAPWEEQYETIIPGEFMVETGEKISVTYLNSYECSFEIEGGRGFSKNYQGGAKFVAILPDEGITVPELMKNITPEKIIDYSKIDGVESDVLLPKFSYETTLNLLNTAKTLGFQGLFDGDVGDLSGLSTNLGAFSDIFQKTNITVNEAGTKAASATAVVAVFGTMETLCFNREFIYFIVLDSDEIAIAGWVRNPAK